MMPLGAFHAFAAAEVFVFVGEEVVPGEGLLQDVEASKALSHSR